MTKEERDALFARVERAIQMRHFLNATDGEALYSTCRELEADADRLDWLDEHPYRIVPHMQHGWSIQAGGPFETTIRAAIDSARKR
jgi:hypothetical protein